MIRTLKGFYTESCKDLWNPFRVQDSILCEPRVAQRFALLTLGFDLEPLRGFLPRARERSESEFLEQPVA